MSPTVDSILEKVDTNVRKWPIQLFYLMAPDAPAPSALFGTDRLPILPTGAIQMGYITTDGIGQEDSVSSEGTNMAQSLEPVRTDLTGIEKTLTVTFGEDNSFVQALWHGVAFSDFPEVKHGAWLFDDGEVTDYPYFRCGWIGQDGVGDQAVYRHEHGYRAKVTAKSARNTSRSAEETYGFTFGLFKDPIAGKSFTRAQNGPKYVRDATATATLDAGAITGITVLDGGMGYDAAPTVTITGDGSGAAATATIEHGIVTAVTVDTAGTGYTSATVGFTAA